MAGGGVVYWGPPESLLPLPRACAVPSLKPSGQDSPFLTICWVIGTWEPVLFRSLEPCGPTSVYIIIAKISLFSWLVRDVPVLVLLHWGGGVVFLKATSYVCPVLLLSLFCLLFCCSALPFSPTSPP